MEWSHSTLSCIVTTALYIDYCELGGLMTCGPFSLAAPHLIMRDLTLSCGISPCFAGFQLVVRDLMLSCGISPYLVGPRGGFGLRPQRTLRHTLRELTTTHCGNSPRIVGRDACYDRGITFRLQWFLNDGDSSARKRQK